MAEHKKRCTRVSKAQKELLVEFMLQNKPFARGQFSEQNSNYKNNSTWELLSSKLNSQGAVIKTVEQWRKCWTDVKSAAKKQARENKTFLNKTGGGSIADGPRPLNDLEEKILSIITMDAVDGDASTPELGGSFVNCTGKENDSDDMVEEFLLEPGEMEPTCSGRNTKAPSYQSALQEARKIQQRLEDKLDLIIEQNKKILHLINFLGN